MKFDCDTLEALIAAFRIAKELPMTVLRQRMTEDMQVRNLSPHTQASYLQQVSLFARYFRMSPDALTPEHIRTYQIYLTNEKRLAPNSIHTAVAALRFLYRITLKIAADTVIAAPIAEAAKISRLENMVVLLIIDGSKLSKLDPV